MSRLRLCFVGPANNITLRRWIGWFTARGHEATVLTVEPVENPSSHGFLQIDLRTKLLPRKLSRLVSAARLAWNIQKLKPDVVHVHYLRGLAWGLLAGRYHPCVVTPWGSDVLAEQGAFRNWYSRAFTTGLLNRADLVTVHSTYMEQCVRMLAPTVHEINRIRWGVNLDRFRSGLDVRLFRKKWDIADHVRVIFSPRLAQRFYNHHLVIAALPKVLRRLPDCLLVISEQHPDLAYLSELKQLAKDLGVESHVKFVGSIPYQDMPLWLNLAGAVIMMPPSDGMPNTLLEAMACGTIPVLSRLPQYAEIITHRENGFLTDLDASTLAETLLEVFSGQTIRERIARVNREKVSEMGDQDREMSRMEEFYWSLSKRSGHVPRQRRESVIEDNMQSATRERATH